MACRPFTPKNWRTFNRLLLLQELNTKFPGITQGRDLSCGNLVLTIISPASKLIAASFLFTVRTSYSIAWKLQSFPGSSLLQRKTQNSMWDELSNLGSITAAFYIQLSTCIHPGIFPYKLIIHFITTKVWNARHFKLESFYVSSVFDTLLN
jgi:hypothetical protein